MKHISKIIIITNLLLIISNLNGYAQANQADTVNTEIVKPQKQEQFYDSLKYKTSQKRITKLLYDILISPPRPYVDTKALAYDYYNQYSGKTISKIEVKSLEVFGPTFADTTRKATSWLERSANNLHTKSNLKSIQKLLLFKVGDILDPDLMYENERIIRSLSYIKDIKFVLEQDTTDTQLVIVHLITKDRFSLGATGNVNGIQSAALELYNQNIFGVGHEISLRFLGHATKQPYLGMETFYKIKNIRGKFLDISFGYLNTYKSEGFQFVLSKPFITTSVKWGYGATTFRMYRTDRIFDSDPIKTELPMDLVYHSAWGGRSFQLNEGLHSNSQVVLSAGVNTRKYYKRPIPDIETDQYFSNRKFFLTGITFTQRRYVQDELVFSYGITEDIPEGFKNEIVYGFDFNELGKRHYAHLLLSNGNLLANRKGYLNMGGSLGGYFYNSGFYQGQINARLNFISKLLNAGNNRYRIYTRIDYTKGLNRFPIENLNLNGNKSIRGFASRKVFGKQRLSLNLEYILFLMNDYYDFNMAVFGFSDIGIIGSSSEFIFTENYYSGIGLGVRLHNENLVFKTIQLRLAFYPFHPSDMNFVGFILDEQSKRQFYSFEPTEPIPFLFE